MKGRRHSEASKAIMSANRKGRPSPMKGKPHTAEAKAKIAAAAIARNAAAAMHTPEAKAKAAAANRARTDSPNAMWGKARRVGEWEPDWHLREIGKLIRDARVERDVSLEELAAATGIGEATLSRIERAKSRRNNNRGATIASIIRIALALGVRPYELMP